jgi:hypothetical protein
MKVHCFCWALRIGYHACCRCGLLKLRNPVSVTAAKRPCPGHED